LRRTGADDAGGLARSPFGRVPPDPISIPNPSCCSPG
jgi:hypothetical protein